MNSTQYISPRSDYVTAQPYTTLLKGLSPMNDAHFAEYAAAAAALHEQTPVPNHEPAVGDFVSGVSGGKPWSGRVQWIGDDGRISIELDGGWIYVSPRDITH